MKLNHVEIENNRIYYLLLALACSNFFGYGSFIFIIFSIYAILFINKKIIVNGFDSIVYVILFVSIFVAGYFHYGVLDAIKALCYLTPPFIVSSGYRIAANKNQFILNTITAIFVGFASEILLIYFYNLIKGQPSDRSLYDVWHDGLLSVTLISVFSSVIIGCSFYGILFEKNKYKRVTCLLALLLVVSINYSTATRTAFVLIGIVGVILFLLYSFKNDVSKAYKIWMLISILMIVIIVSYVNDLFGIKHFITSSHIYERFTLESGDARSIINKRYLEHLVEFPFGGMHIFKIVNIYAHNVLLEMYDVYGVVPAIIMTFLYLESLFNIARLTIIKDSTNINFLFLGLYLAIGIQMFTEPVLEGYPIIVWIYFITHELAKKYINNFIKQE